MIRSKILEENSQLFLLNIPYNFQNVNKKILAKFHVSCYTTLGRWVNKVNKMLNRDQQTYLLNMARNTIEAYLERKEILEQRVSDPELTNCQGIFVSLHKGHDLRGCIGYIQPIEPLYEAVIKMAIAASTQDWRFPTVTLKELKDITIEITVLSELTPIQDISQIEIGTHGVQLTIGNHSAVFLPQVAEEQGWNREETLQHLCLKAGLRDDDWKMPDTRLSIFTGQVFNERYEI